jgi:beta-glucosidase
MESKIENIIREMTLDEKISLLAGQDMWHTQPVERLGIPSIRVSDGPNGVRGAGGNYTPSSACFPCGTALAATWDTGLVESVGQALAEEVKSKSAHILLAPTVNIHRSPIAGRNFECYSEDPYLAGQMASSYITGLQKNGVGACIKHFVCNDQEFERFSISSEVQERPLREIYLEPFRIAVEKAKPWSVMSAYNRINGQWANSNDYTLREILKKEWGFDGMVISDWYGTYDSTAASGGLDVEMPGPGRWASLAEVKAALAQGRISEGEIDDKVRRILRTMERVGAFDNPGYDSDRADDRPEHRRLIRQAGADAIVLLKNDGLLPLQHSRVKKLLVIGQNAALTQYVGGGSAYVHPHYLVSPLDGIRQHAGEEMEVSYTLGAPLHRSLPAANPVWFRNEEGQSTLRATIFDNPDLQGEPVLEKTVDRTHFAWFGIEQAAPGQDNVYLRLRGTFFPPESGTFTLGLKCIGKGRLLVDGREVLPLQSYDDPSSWNEAGLPLPSEAGVPQEITVEYLWSGENHWRMVELALLPPAPIDPLAEAEALAREADAVVIVAGLTREWESEGSDRVDMRLPGAQNELIARVAAVNPRTMVALNAGSPLEMPWLGEVAAVLQTWYAGQESGNALADVLFGQVTPSGKLPVTFPRRLEDNPSYLNFPGENGKVLYGEGLYVGYRYYDRKDVEPLFPFGHGLSYTTFEYSGLKLSSSSLRPGDTLQVAFTIKNTGPAAGAEAAQLYLRDPKARLQRPEKELKGFAKVFLEPGEAQTVTLVLDQQSLSFYDPAKPGWIAEPGQFEVLVGASSRDLRLRGTFTLED